MARSSIVVMLAFLVSKAVGLLRERAIAHQFGAGADYDAYVAAFTVPDILFTLIAGGALLSAFLPVFGQALAVRDDRLAWRIGSGVTNIVFLATLAAAVIVAITAPWLVATVLAPEFPPDQQALTVALMRIILVGTLVFAVSGIQMGMLNAFHHFLLPAVAPIAYNLGILFGAVALAPQLGIRGLAYGVVIGAALHLLVKVPGLVRYGFRWWPILGLDLPGVRQVFRLMWPRVLALGTVRAVSLVNTRLATALATGSLSAFNYAWLIAQMPQTILGTAVGTVAFPTLAEQAALDERDALRRTIVGTLRVLVALSVPTAAALWVLSGPAIDVLLRTGAFGAEAARATQTALTMFALGLVAHVTLEVVARAFYAQQDTLTPLRGALIAMAANIGLAFLLVVPMAQAGLALANSAAVTLEVVVLLWWLWRRLPGLDVASLVDVLWRSTAAAALMVAAIHAALVGLGRVPAVAGLGPLPGGLLALGLGCAVGTVAYVVAAGALGIDEVRTVVTELRSRAGRGRS